jgi:hypothetical protein
VFVVVVPFSALMLFWAIRGLFIFILLLVIGLWHLSKWLFSTQYRQSLRTLKPLGIRPPGETARELHRQYSIEPSGAFRPYAGPPWRQPGALKNYRQIAPGHWRPIEPFTPQSCVH